MELRERVVQAVLEDGNSYEEAAIRFKVGEASVSRWLSRARDGRLEPVHPSLNGRFPVIRGDLAERLRLLVMERPEDTLAELVDRFDEATGVRVSRATMGRALHAMRISRKKRPSKRKSATRSA